MQRSIRLLLALALLVVAALPFTARVQAQEPGDFVLGETSVVVPANGEATINFQTFCLEFGKEFPSSLGMPDGRAQDDVLQVVKTALEGDVASDNPLAVQLAIWSLLENQELGQLYPDVEELPAREQAQQLLDDASDTEVSPLAEDRGTPLTEAVADGTIEATSEDFRFVETDKPRPDDEPYHGEGTLVLTNTTDEDVEVYFPFGTVFRANTDTEQDIVAYATELEQLPTPTPAPTNTPAPTATPAPTPDTVPETGGPSDAAPTSPMPWFLVTAGLILLASAGVLIARYEA